MTDAEELDWLRSWRSRIISAMRIWWKSETYKQSCSGWSQIVSILNEKGPGE